MRITKRRSPRPKGRTLPPLIFLLILTILLLLVASSYLGLEEESVLIQNKEDVTNDCRLETTPTRSISPTNSTTKSCFKVVTYSGGFGNRLGPMLCALGLAEQLHLPLHVLWNAANEGVPGELKPSTTRATQRQGYNLTDLQQAVQLPFHFIETPKANCREVMSKQTDFTFYPPAIEKGVEQWKAFYRTIDAAVVHDYELREQAFDALDCYNIPTVQGTSKINGYTPEPCFAKYTMYAKTDPDFAYLQPLLHQIGSKNEYVRALIRATRRIQPTMDLCIPNKGLPYMVVHARRGDRWPTDPTDIASATPIVRNVLARVQLLNVMIISDNAAEREILVQECRRHSIPVIQPSCTAQELVDRNGVYHAPTMAVLQDYFAMAGAVGILSDFLRSESSFSTTAALGNDIPLLYFGNRSNHAMKRVEERGGGARMRNVYFLEHVEDYVQAVVQLREKNKVSSKNERRRDTAR